MLCVVTPLIALTRSIQLLEAPKARFVLVLVTIALAAQSIAAAQARVPDKMASAIHLKFAAAVRNAVPVGTRVRVIAAGTAFTVSPEAMSIVLLRARRIPVLQPFEPRIPGAHRCVTGAERLPTLVLSSGPAVEELRTKLGGQLLLEYDPISKIERAEALRLLRSLETELRANGMGELVTALNDGALWLSMRELPGVNRADLEEYLRLAGGDERRAYALYYFQPTTW